MHPVLRKLQLALLPPWHALGGDGGRRCRVQPSTRARWGPGFQVQSPGVLALRLAPPPTHTPTPAPTVPHHHGCKMPSVCQGSGLARHPGPAPADPNPLSHAQLAQARPASSTHSERRHAVCVCAVVQHAYSVWWRGSFVVHPGAAGGTRRCTPPPQCPLSVSLLWVPAWGGAQHAAHSRAQAPGRGRRRQR